VDQRLALITPQLTYAGFEKADLIVEAVFEDMGVKKEVFAQLDVWSRAVGFPEAKRIGKACGDALADRSPVIDGIQVGWFVPRDELYRTDADGLTAHGLLMFQSRCRPLGIDEPEPPDGGEENFFPDRYFASRYFSQRYFG